MSADVRRVMTPVPFNRVAVEDSFWSKRQATNKKSTVPYIYDLWERTGRLSSAIPDNTKTGQPELAYVSDVAKWLESASYSLATHPDDGLDQLVESVIDVVEKDQQTEVARQWAGMHTSLYSLGHLIEAGVAHYEATGKRTLLDIVCRYADYIDSSFGPEPGKNPGFTAHEEVELALVRLYRATGEEKYLNLAKFFIDERGPHQPALSRYFNGGANARGSDETQWPWSIVEKYDQWQAHRPVRQQTTAEGHSVMATYLYCGMADVAAETGDRALLDACKTIWRNVVSKRMYLTGGIGPSCEGERFTIDYDLPNDTAYVETCAAIGLVFWAHRMLQIECDSEYADVMERALYNGTISGVSLAGDRFFYANPLVVDPDSAYYRKTAPEINRVQAPNTPMGFFLYEFKKRNRIKPVRQETFDPPCCLPNISRLIASIGQFIYAESEQAATVHLYVKSRAELRVAGQKVSLAQDTSYPWDGNVTIAVEPETPASFTVRLRVPAWCPDASIYVNGEKVQPQMEKGYAQIHRTWSPEDKIRLELEMPVQRIYSHPRVSANAGRVALQRGPVVYCLEEVDNGENLAAISLPRDSQLEATFEEGLLGGVVTIKGKALKLEDSDWNEQLYSRGAPSVKEVGIKAVPYSVWCNREPGEMLVWLQER